MISMVWEQCLCECELKDCLSLHVSVCVCERERENEKHVNDWSVVFENGEITSVEETSVIVSVIGVLFIGV